MDLVIFLSSSSYCSRVHLRQMHVSILSLQAAMALKRESWCRNLLAASLLSCVLLQTTDVHARPANMSAAKDKYPANKDENEILPPDHLNGVKMEMDGHLNKDFHQEVFLGKEIEEFEEDSEPRRNRKKLIEIFTK